MFLFSQHMFFSIAIRFPVAPISLLIIPLLNTNNEVGWMKLVWYKFLRLSVKLYSIQTIHNTSITGHCSVEIFLVLLSEKFLFIKILLQFLPKYFIAFILNIFSKILRKFAKRYFMEATNTVIPSNSNQWSKAFNRTKLGKALHTLLGQLNN